MYNVVCIYIPPYTRIQINEEFPNHPNRMLRDRPICAEPDSRRSPDRNSADIQILTSDRVAEIRCSREERFHYPKERASEELNAA